MERESENKKKIAAIRAKDNRRARRKRVRYTKEKK